MTTSEVAGFAPAVYSARTVAIPQLYELLTTHGAAFASIFGSLSSLFEDNTGWPSQRCLWRQPA